MSDRGGYYQDYTPLWIVVVFVLVVIVCALGLQFVYSTNQAPGAPVNCPVQSYGNGVYFFGCTDSFNQALADWKGEHPNSTVVTIVFRDQYPTRGFTVVTEP